MKRFTSTMLAVFLLCVTLVAAVPASMQANPTPQPTITPVQPLDQPAGSTEITFWYGLGGSKGNVVQSIVNQYNSSQSKYYVKAIFQSGYEGTINKINAGLAGGDLPNVAQVFEAGTQRMIDTQKIVPMQDLIDRDKLQSMVDNMEPAVRANYTVNGKLYSMPFNASTAIVFIHRNAFKEVGLDPDKRSWTFDEILDASQQLTKKDASGALTRYGITFYADSWPFEENFAAHATLFGDPANGHTGRMTAYTFNNAIGVEYFDFMKKAVDAGTGVFYGSSSGAQDSSDSDFVQGKASMEIDTIADLRSFGFSIEQAGLENDLGVIYLPHDADAKGRSMVGGASLWITSTGTAEQQEGSWDFVKFAMRPEIQAFWSANTGYYPVIQAAYDDPVMKEALAKYPQFQVAVDAIRSAPISDTNSSHVSGTFVSMRQNVVQAMDDFMSGKVSAQEALDVAVKASNDQLDEYNSTVQ